MEFYIPYTRVNRSGCGYNHHSQRRNVRELVTAAGHGRRDSQQLLEQQRALTPLAAAELLRDLALAVVLASPGCYS